MYLLISFAASTCAGLAVEDDKIRISGVLLVEQEKQRQAINAEIPNNLVVLFMIFVLKIA